jgi:hypothetical protein
MRYSINLQIRNGQDIQSPRFEEAKAKADLDAISRAQESRQFCVLSWLTIDGADILSANLLAHDRGPIISVVR